MRDGEIVSICFAKPCRWRNGLQKTAKATCKGLLGRTFYNSVLCKPFTTPAPPNLPAILAQRIVILDGAMGTMIQRFKLGEAQYRARATPGQTAQATGSGLSPRCEGQQRVAEPDAPDVIRDIHERYLAGCRPDRDQHLWRHHHRAGRLRHGRAGA